MALIGGAGNPVGGSFTGPAEALEVIGNHIYGYSGAVDIGTATGDATLLDFTTGNYYTVGEIQIGCESATGNDFIWIVKLAGTTIFEQYFQNSMTEHPLQTSGLNIIIPSYTPIEVIINHATGSDATVWTTSLVGRLYRD